MIPEWEMSFRPSPFAYLLSETRIDSDQLVRVFLNVNVMLIGLSPIAFTSIGTARLSPQPEKPIPQVAPAGSVLAAFADTQS